MIRASTRFLPHIVALILAATVPTWLHWTSSFNVDDCADPDALLGGLRDARKFERIMAKWPQGRLRFLERASLDGRWAAGRLPVGDGEALDFAIVRSYDAKRVYHLPDGGMHWERGKSMRADRQTVETIEAEDMELPVHRAHYDIVEAQKGNRWVVAYLLVYGSRPVDNPYLEQLLSSPLQLVRGRTPMWLFFVSGQVDPDMEEAAERAAKDWIRDAWMRYEAACHP